MGISLLYVKCLSSKSGEYYTKQHGKTSIATYKHVWNVFTYKENIKMGSPAINKLESVQRHSAHKNLEKSKYSSFITSPVYGLNTICDIIFVQK